MKEESGLREDMVGRRRFLAATLATGATLPFVARARLRAADDSVPAPPEVPLGKTGVTLSRLGQGTGMRGGRRQSDHTRQGFEKLVTLFRHASDRGVTFFDLADLYGSHLYFREALRSIPREKATILTKVWWRQDGPPAEVPADYQRRSARATLTRFLEELGTDRLDIVLLHCVVAPDWDRELAGYMEELAAAKKKGVVRALGISTHSLDGLRTAAASPWVDVILARINPRGAKMDGTPEEVVPILRQARQNGKAILGMKIYGEGTLIDHRDECMAYAQRLGLLDAMTIGSVTPEQLDDNLRLMARHPAAPIPA